VKEEPVKKLLMVLVVAATAILPVATAGPAAAATRCTSGWWKGPYWSAGVDATNDAGHRKVLAVREPWDATSSAYIWDYNSDNRQKWYLECVSYNESDVINVYRFRLASNTGDNQRWY